MRKVSYEINGQTATFKEAENNFYAKTILTEIKEKSGWKNEDGVFYQTWKQRKEALNRGEKLTSVSTGLQDVLN